MTVQEAICIKAMWDNEARVWVANSEDVPGLITESGNLQDLDQKLKTLIPELLEANGSIGKYKNTEIPFHIYSERSEIASCKEL